jgi:hypothetical protein
MKKTCLSLSIAVVVIFTGSLVAQTCGVGHTVSRSTTCQCNETVQAFACQGATGQCQAAIDWVSCGSSCSVGSSRDGCSPLGFKKSSQGEVLNASCVNPLPGKEKLDIDYFANDLQMKRILNW